MSFGRLSVDFELSSAVAPCVFVRRHPDRCARHRRADRAGRSSEPLGPDAEAGTAPQTPPDRKEQPLPRLRIGSFKVTRGVLSYEDRSRPTEFGARLEPINFEMREFSTGVEGGRFTFTCASKLGERMEWHGHLSVQPIESDGELRIEGLQARTLWEYLADRLNFEIGSGALNLAATYKMSLGDKLDLHADISRIAMNG